MPARLIAAAAMATALAACSTAPAELPEAAVDRAATCGVVAATQARATITDIKAPLSFDQQGDVLRPALLHAGSSGSYDAKAAAAVVERMPVLGGELNNDRIAQLAPQCAQAFPPAPADLKLPDDPLDAALGCETMGDFMAQALEAQASDYGSELTRLASLGRVLDDRIAPLLQRRGVRGSEAAAEQGRKSMASITRTGSPGKIIEACFARYLD